LWQFGHRTGGISVMLPSGFRRIRTMGQAGLSCAELGDAAPKCRLRAGRTGIRCGIRAVNRIGGRFRNGVRRFAGANHIPVVRFAKADRKIDVMRKHLAAAGSDDRSGVACNLATAGAISEPRS
jgi:hypothetical protein